VTLPFGGVPIGVKELTPVQGWPDTEASVPLRDHIAGHTATMVDRNSGSFSMFHMSASSSLR